MEKTALDATHATLEHRLILSSRVVGKSVFDKSGTRLGHVDDLSVEKVGGRVIYGIMSFGGLFGIGERFHPVPWSLLVYDVERDGFTVPLDPSVLEGAPSYDREELRELGGASHRRYADTIFDYYGPYGAVPYW